MTGDPECETTGARPPTSGARSGRADGDAAPDDAAPDDADPGPAPEEALERIEERATAVRNREVETALARLEASGDLSAAEREVVERLADRLAARLVAVPERGLRGAEEGDETVETALELFG